MPDKKTVSKKKKVSEEPKGMTKEERLKEFYEPPSGSRFWVLRELFAEE
jgi:hypothetical protein